MAYLLHILILICIYSILSVSLNLVAGYTGLMSLAHAAFYGIGAYVAGLMALNLDTPFWLNLTCAAIFSGLMGAMVGIPALRIRDDYFAIATFGLQVVTFSILNNWISVTRGPMGIPGIPKPVIFDWTVSSPSEFLLLSAIFVALILWVARRLVNSPWGRVLKAIREDEVFVLSLGKNVTAYKVIVFIIGSMMAAVAGSLYAYYISFIDPTSFTVMESIFIISLVIVGGAGSLWGSVIGAVVLVTLPELLRFVGLPSTVAANIRQILYGGLLVGFMLWRPQGLMGEFSFQTNNVKGEK